MARIGVLTSGGDSPGMNAAVRAIVRFGIDRGMEVYGISRGYEGLIDGEIEKMERRSVGDILQRGGTILKTARSKRFMTEEGQERAVRNLETFRIDALVVIGGNGSYAGALELSKRGVPVICLPGTIDNDLGYTDYTIGFDTAVNTVLDAITRIRDTSSAHERTTVIEVMGRHCGDIAIYSGLAGGAEYVLIPEVEPDLNDISLKILEGVNKGRLHSIIINAEGSMYPSDVLVENLSERTGREVKLVVLSYLQRGGSPTLQDRLLATECGAKAVELIDNGIYNKAIGTVGGEIMGFDLEEALKQENCFDRRLYDAIGVLSK
ncbi:MAG: 6-phosphofructokinase [Eubacteriales bacterium]|jgi:6-phosphofructokinase 1|uniref:ATP-dependent 6-phosphofructokinase n=1 Tax=Baileyella intestinalis TaxID=2606709 RepID=A0A6A8MC11_9FIRM|nr:6-phosphofructokinase [Baileyella intestinalis]MCI7685815.1 6-phosphofructokinase [Clostridiales bacterium]MDD5875509.1 6-phosphofructokinase [Baileyella intestinalis]MDY2994452.1 6-phosphofructokinase [Baileyella intestinalis]MST69494.1 6-phosphofructokinase [Baileyella intestinalis]